MLGDESGRCGGEGRRWEDISKVLGDEGKAEDGGKSWEDISKDVGFWTTSSI